MVLNISKDIKFLFYSRVIKGSKSTSFNHQIFNISYVDDKKEILYFENINMNGNKIEDLDDPTIDGDAVNKKYLKSETDKLLPLSGGTMTGNLNMGNKRIVDCGRLIMKRDGKSPIDLN